MPYARPICSLKTLEDPLGGFYGDRKIAVVVIFACPAIPEPLEKSACRSGALVAYSRSERMRPDLKNRAWLEFSHRPVNALRCIGLWRRRPPRFFKFLKSFKFYPDWDRRDGLNRPPDSSLPFDQSTQTPF
jgi:hypothetical protein